MFVIIKAHPTNESVNINVEGLSQEQILEAAYEEFKKVESPITAFPISSLELIEHNGEHYIDLRF